MALPAAAISVTLITLISIFSFYKFVLDKPAPKESPVPSAVSLKDPTISPSPEVSPSKVSTSASPKPSASKISATPKPSEGKITILQNNTVLSPNTGPSSSTSQTISGTINLIGSAPSGSTFVIASRPTGSGEQFKVVLDGITAQNNASWSWNQAKNGVRYDLFAVLKGKSGSVDIDYASSPASTVTAPYQGQVLVVDTGYALSAPTGSASVSCTTHLSNNSWNTTVSFPAVTGAKMYHVQIGTTSGGNDLLDTTLNAQSVTPNLSDSVNYYFRYSVSSVSNPTAYQYSSYSSVSTIRCP